MKRHLILYFLLAWKLVSIAQIPIPNEFVLSGEIQGAKEKTVYLLYTNSKGSKEHDSCRLQNGRFSFRGSISEPTFGLLRINKEVIADSENKNMAALFLEPVNMGAKIIYDHFDEMTLTGSNTHKEYTTLDKKHRVINETYSDSLYERHSKLSEEFIYNHNDSYISAYLLSSMRGRWPKNSVQFLFTRFNAKVQSSSYGREIKAFLDDWDTNSEGRKANDFTSKDFQGEIIKLSDFSGKYLLLDFWGSWCVPCRESSPHLIELFKKYSGKGFSIIGIATEYEQTGTKWKEAIQNDGTDIWYNILSNPLPGSPGRFTKEIAEHFAVHVFPTKLLIDPCGYIIGRYQGTEEDVRLDEQLKEIYN